MQYNQYTYEYVKDFFSQNGHVLISKEYSTCKDNLLYEDKDGYRYTTSFDRYKNKPNSNQWKYHPSNIWSVWNINIWAQNNNIATKCISKEYAHSDQYLAFKCSCGNIYHTTRASFMTSKKVKCDKCTGYNTNKTYDDVKKDLKSVGFYLDIKKEDYKGITLSTLYGHDSEGYKYKITYDAAMRGESFEKYSKSNPFSINNINHYLKQQRCHFICVSSQYLNNSIEYDFKCLLCGKIVKAKWGNVNRNDNNSRYPVKCPNCDGRNESLHAIVLKQLFQHYEPDTIVEDLSCINPKTNKVMPTDIVNHRLKIAIEVQSQWHDFESAKEKDAYKKTYWTNRGYSFFDPDIRDYSILGMAQLFFDITEIPSFVDYDIANKLDIRKIQQKLNEGLSVPEIEELYNVSRHRIYDAVAAKKLFYPKNYHRPDHTPVIQFDKNWNYITEYNSIKEAAEANNINSSNISSALSHGRHYSGGFNWMRKKDYIAKETL